MDILETDTLIIGASVSGLACAACLHKKNVDYIIIEKQAQVATPWRNHYERLHLHTSKRFSNLPYKKFDSHIPRYPSRQQVIDYLENYQRAFHIKPVFNTTAVSLQKENDDWITHTSHGIIQSKKVIIATGVFGTPKPVQFRGMDSFKGKILHSTEYKTGKDFKGQKVLVVGFGNSACEIAIDLYEQGAEPFMAVRSAVNVVPRDVLGIPILELSLLMKTLPPRIADKINMPVLQLFTGDISKLGLRKKELGPLESIQKEGAAPVLDIGTIKHIRQQHITVLGDIDYIDGSVIHFVDGQQQSFDAIVAAIGYTPGYNSIPGIDLVRQEDARNNILKQKYFGKDNLYFCGHWISPTGQIREIAMDAQRISDDIAHKKKKKNAIAKRYISVCMLLSLILVSAEVMAQSNTARPFVLGKVEELNSVQLGEKRILNIYTPEGYNKNDTVHYPVIYLLDGSAEEDFIHIVGLVQFKSFSWVHVLPPSIVVGIANTDRKKDFTYPTTIAEDKKNFPTTGHSDKFISFLEKELQPFIEKNYKTAASKTIIGESLGGLLATEILLKKPSLFNQYIIVSPSLWWDNASLLKQPTDILASGIKQPTGVYIGVGKEGLAPTSIPHVMEVDANVLADRIRQIKNPLLHLYFDYLPGENHASIIHPAVSNAFHLLNPAK